MKGRSLASNVSPNLAYAKFVSENPLIREDMDIVEYAAERFVFNVINGSFRGFSSRDGRKNVINRLKIGHDLMKKFYGILDERFDISDVPNAEDFLVIYDMMQGQKQNESVFRYLSENLRDTQFEREENFPYCIDRGLEKLYQEMVIHHIFKPLEIGRRETLMDNCFQDIIAKGKEIGGEVGYYYKIIERLEPEEIEKLGSHFKPFYDNETQRFYRLGLHVDRIDPRLHQNSSAKEAFDYLEHIGEMDFHGYEPTNEGFGPYFDRIGNFIVNQMINIYRVRK